MPSRMARSRQWCRPMGMSRVRQRRRRSRLWRRNQRSASEARGYVAAVTKLFMGDLTAERCFSLPILRIATPMATFGRRSIKHDHSMGAGVAHRRPLCDLIAQGLAIRCRLSKILLPVRHRHVWLGITFQRARASVAEVFPAGGFRGSEVSASRSRVHTPAPSTISHDWLAWSGKRIGEHVSPL